MNLQVIGLSSLSLWERVRVRALINRTTTNVFVQSLTPALFQRERE
jgi:hypothetical protein